MVSGIAAVLVEVIATVVVHSVLNMRVKPAFCGVDFGSSSIWYILTGISSPAFIFYLN